MLCPRCDRKLSVDDRFCSRCGLARSTDGEPVDPLIGLTIADRYRIEERIGVGGMGTVYRAKHVRFGQDVAIKVLHERHTQDPKLAHRFEQEALTYGKVSHPNLVGLHDFGQTQDGTFYMALEYCPGTPLSNLLRTQRNLSVKLACDVVLQVAQALGAAHDRGIVHRDLKPENVILTQIRPGKYHVHLLDFGIAKLEDDDGPRLTQAGMVFGTPEYMSPEQARGRSVDNRSDIYALGTLFYELLVGRPPFHGADKLRVMQQQANELPEPPSRLIDEELPQALEAVIMECLEKEPTERIQEISHFLERVEFATPATMSTDELDIRQYMIDEPVDRDTEAQLNATVVNPASDVNYGADQSESALSPKGENWKFSHRHLPITERHLPIVGAILTLIVIVIGGGLLVRGTSDADSQEQVSAQEIPTENVKTGALPAKEALVNTPSDQQQKTAPEIEKSQTANPKPAVTKKVEAKPTLATTVQKSQHATQKAPIAKTSSDRHPLENQIVEALKKQKLGIAKKLLADFPVRANHRKKDTALKSRLTHTLAVEAKALEKKNAKARLAHIKAAKKHLISADFTQAIKSLDRAENYGGTGKETKNLRGQVKRAQATLVKAKKHYARADCRKTLDTLKPIISLTPKSKRVARLVSACQDALPPQRL